MHLKPVKNVTNFCFFFQTHLNNYSETHEEVYQKLTRLISNLLLLLSFLSFFLELGDRLRISLLIRANFRKLFNFYYP